MLLLARSFLVTITVVNISMAPSIKQNDRLLAIHPWPKRWLRRGQVVIIRSQTVSSGSPTVVYCIKRVIGLPGETLVTYISDLDESRQLRYKGQYNDKGERIWYIPPGYFFVKGDNRWSVDSRDWGPIPLSYLAGIAIMKMPRKAIKCE